MRIIVMFLFLIQVGTIFPRQTDRIMYGPAMLIPIDPDLDQAHAPRIRRADAPPAPPAQPRQQSNEPRFDDSDSEKD